MEKTMHRGLLSYLEVAVEQSMDLFKKPLKIPERGHYFWECLPPMGKDGPPWLNENLFTVPWRAVLEHPERPRCERCHFWSELKNDSEGGLCFNSALRLGRLTPREAFCGEYQCKKKSNSS
jgi:hypothetical protein